VDIFLQWVGYVYLGLCFPLRMVSGGLEIKAHHPWELRHSLARVGIVPPWESRHPLINCKVFPSGLVGGGLKIKAHHPWRLEHSLARVRWNSPPLRCELRYPLAGVVMFPPFGVVGGGLKIKARHPTWTLIHYLAGVGIVPPWELRHPLARFSPFIRG
jgi:hypothetical protein